MDYKKLAVRLFLLILLIFLVNYSAMQFHWYSSIWYLDMPMHFFGGFWIGLAFIWLFKIKEISFRLILKIISVVLLVGVLWEFFEIVVNNYIILDSFNTLDTLSDIFFDLAGGIFAILYFLKKVSLIKEDIVQ
ncbi:MAG: hypothetical protein WCS86_01595 [Candidatus Paceibacterota bacterium]|jgi:hypothetical protein